MTSRTDLARVAVVIPACDERGHLDRTLASLQESARHPAADAGRFHVVVVVNHPSDAPEEVKVRSREDLERLRPLEREAGIFSLTLVDATEPGLTFGVGEARKVGMDYAVNRILSEAKDRIVSLDADALVSPDYVPTLQRHPLKGAGFVLPFEHPIEASEDPQAMILYELYLRYIERSLEQAGSPFSFFTIGSAMGTDLMHYRLSGGMLRRSATEDFHFLNKLRKLGPIERWDSPCVYPSARLSSRVYLGTGHFLSTYARDPAEAFAGLMLPSPGAFERLANFLCSLDSSYASPPLEDSADPATRIFLISEKMIPKLAKLRANCAGEESFRKRLVQVFDFIKTWRLLRAYSAEESPPTPKIFLVWCSQIFGVPDVDPLAVLHRARTATYSTSELSGWTR